MLLAPPVAFGYNDAADDFMFDGLNGVSLTASGTTHTMGSWTSILGTITYDLFWIAVCFKDASTSATSEQVLVDLGIGPDASNVTPVAEFLMAGSSSLSGTGSNTGRWYYGPLFIPAGTQLWGRCQSNIASNVVTCNVFGWGGPDRPASFPVVFLWKAEGEDAANSVGTAVTSGGTGAWGSYAQMTASCAFDYCGALMAHAVTDTTMTDLGRTGEIGIGAATEQDLGPSYFAPQTTAEIINSQSLPVFANIPAGTRIAVRLNGGASDTGVSCIAYGLAY